MTPLIFAAAVVLTGPIQQPLDAPPASPLLKAPPSAPARVYIKPDLLMDLPAGRNCSEFPVKTAGPDGMIVKKLGDLPPGLPEHAVLRTIHGCPVREIMFAGGTYYLGLPDYKVQGASPAAQR